jgi:hypothetical protein
MKLLCKPKHARFWRVGSAAALADKLSDVSERIRVTLDRQSNGGARSRVQVTAPRSQVGAAVARVLPHSELIRGALGTHSLAASMAQLRLGM